MSNETSENPENPGWRFHSDHTLIVAETHARPSQPVSGPANVIHLALRCDEETVRHFFGLLEEKSGQQGPRHRTGIIDGFEVKLEQHTEFLSCTVFQNLVQNKPDQAKLTEFLRETFPMDKVEILVFLQLTVLTSMPAMLKAISGTNRIYGGKIRNDIDIRSTFVPDSDGITRFALHCEKITRDELGRRIQRILEMETYRTMSLLGLPVARRVGQELTDLETKLAGLTQNLGNETNTSQEEDEELYKQLSDLSELSNALLTQTRYRFAASHAYFALFNQRTDSLEETKVGELQTMSGFLRSRIEPAMATISSTAKRQQTLTDDLSRAIVLLRTRIELNLNKGNQELLKSMDRRHDQQLKISETVEGLSIIAITYYAVGLVSYFLKALAKQPFMPLSQTTLTAISVPFIFLIVFLALRRVRKAWEENRGRA